MATPTTNGLKYGIQRTYRTGRVLDNNKWYIGPCYYLCLPLTETIRSMDKKVIILIASKRNDREPISIATFTAPSLKSPVPRHAVCDERPSVINKLHIANSS